MLYETIDTTLLATQLNICRRVAVNSTGARLSDIEIWSDNGVLNYLFPKSKLIEIGNLICIYVYRNKSISLRIININEMY